MTMNTIRSCFTATVAVLVVAIGGRVASSMDNIVTASKCCPVDRLYDPKVRSCRPVGANGDEHDQRLMDRLGSEFRVAYNATLKSYFNFRLSCDATEVLVEVPTEEVRMLMEADPSTTELPWNYCFDLTPTDELVARTCRPHDQYCGRGNYMCVRKCCPADQLYDPKVRFCRPVGADGDEHDQRLMDRLGSGFRVATNATSKSYIFDPSHCDGMQVLVDVPTEEVRMLMEANTSPIELPLNYCFDLTPSDELVARTCRPLDQYCGRGNYTCVEKCCGEESIFFEDPKRMGMLVCEYSEIPFQFSAYETDVGGSPVGLSNNKVLQYHGGLSQCSFFIWIHNRVTLTTDGNLYVIHEGAEWIIPTTKYCVDYHAKDETTGPADLKALVCSKPPVSFLFWFKTLSVVCLVVTLIVYATLPYLRNAHGYYVMFYMACHLVYLVCIMISSLVDEDIDSPLCIPFGFFMLFATLITCCWLNVICFDIYWMLRYNNSTNRNTSKSVRTIMYHIYCFGFSSICVSIGYLFQHSENETLWELAPDIGLRRCFFFDIHRYGTLIFYWLPSCVTLTVNLILFLLTAIHCSRIKSELNKFRRTDSKTEIFLFYKERFVMSIKLFLVFGIPFLFSLLCELFQCNWITRMIIDSIHGLQGVFLFIIFVAKRNVIMDLRKKFRRSLVHSELTPLNNMSGPS